MSLLKGIQSAIFYYLSCAPCTQFAHKKRRRKQAQLDRREREMLEIEQPGLYRHPSPFATNPFWQEEMTLGPGPPPRRAKKKGKDSLKRGTTSASMESTRGSTPNSDGETDDLDTSVHGDRRHSLNPKHWNFRRYQREDEALWGQSLDRELAESGTDASSQRLSRSNTDARYSRTETMYIARNPPVNDLHPPVVSTPSPNLNETRWMLQPPPPAKVMSGKERAIGNRSRSSTTASRSGSQSKPFPPKTATSSEAVNAADGTPAQKPLTSDTSLNTITPTRTTSSSGNRTRRRPDPISITPAAHTATIENAPLRATNAQIDITDFANITPTAAPHATSRRLSTTKRLSTILSSESGLATAPARRKENAPSSSSETVASATTSSSASSSSASLGVSGGRKRRTAADEAGRGGPLVVSDSSLHVLEELVSPAALLDSRFVKAPAVEARISLPPASSVEELQLERGRVEVVGGAGAGAGARKAGGEEGTRFGDEWRRETKRKDSGMVEMPRDVRTRWSMDI